jgi:PST family polysaccharide transporter
MNSIQSTASKVKSALADIRSFLLENRTTGQTVAKNTIWLSISNFGGRLLKAVVIIYAARVLDPVGWGIFSYAVTLAGFFTLFVDPGINVMLMREGSKTDEDGKARVFSTTFYMKLVLIALVVLFVIFVGPLFTTLPGASALLPIAALIIIGDTLREFFSSFIRMKEKMEWEAGIFMLTNACIVIFGFIVLFTAPSARSFGWAYAAGTSIGAIVALWPIRSYISKLFSSFSSKLVWPIIRSAWPFAVTGALGVLLTNADILIISWMKTAADVGIYSAVVRIIQVLYLFPTIIQYSILPILSKVAGKNPERFRQIFEPTIAVIFAASIPMAFAGIFLGTPIMKFVFGAAYAAGGLSLSLLLLTMIVDYPGGVISIAVFAHDHQKSLITASVIGGVSNVLFDLILIPRFGITGSAVATLIAQILNNVYLWYVMKKINYFEVLPRLKKITAASAIMAVASGLLLYMHVNLLAIIGICVVIYFALLMAFKDPLFKEMIKTVRMFSRSNRNPEIST